MGARERMTQRVTVERSAPGAVDDYGQPTPGAFATLSTLPCWVWTDTEAENAQGARVEQLFAIVPRGSDVAESDRLSNLVDRRGLSVRAGLMQIEAVYDRHDHLQLALRSVE